MEATLIPVELWLLLPEFYLMRSPLKLFNLTKYQSQAATHDTHIA